MRSTHLATGGDATTAAAREMVRLDTMTGQRAAEATVRRTALRMQRAVTHGAGG